MSGSFRKGKTYEELYGKEKSKELKERLSRKTKKQTGIKNSFYGKHHSQKTKVVLRNKRLGKTYEELYGEEKALDIKSKLRNDSKKWYSDYYTEYDSRFFDPAFRKKILLDQNFICPICFGKLGIKFKKNLHHINYIKKDNRRRNLVYLCVGCHTTTNSNRDFWKAYLKKINREIIRTEKLPRRLLSLIERTFSINDREKIITRRIR